MVVLNSALSGQLSPNPKIRNSFFISPFLFPKDKHISLKSSVESLTPTQVIEFSRCKDLGYGILSACHVPDSTVSIPLFLV